MKLISLKNRIGADNRRHLSANGFSLLPLALRPRLFLILLGLIGGARLYMASPTFATYSASMSTSGSQSIDVSASGDGVAISADAVTVTTNCRAGYNLSVATSVNDNNLYYDGSVSNNANGTYFEPVDGINTLANNTNKWGYYYNSSNANAPTKTNVFSAVPASSSTPAALVTPTASETDISDSFNVYFGVSINSNLKAGTYRMIQDTNNNNSNGSITYYLTMATSCMPYTVVFNPTSTASGSSVSGTGTMNSQTIPVGDATALNANTFIAPSGYEFDSWNTAQDGSGTTYADQASVTDLAAGGGSVTLYAQWRVVATCAANTICYDGNGATDGAMDDFEITEDYKKDLSFCNDGYDMEERICYTYDVDTDEYDEISFDDLPDNNYYTLDLLAPNYYKTNYGFAGWNTMTDGTGANYGPNETITMNNTELTLYAKWVPIAKDSNNNDLTFQTNNLLTATLSDGNTLSSKPNGYVTALKDARDNQVYAVAKLADGNYWMIENLRLNTAGSDDGTKAQGFGTGFRGLPNAESGNFGSYRANNLYDTGSAYTMPRYNNNNTNSPVVNMTGANGNIYSYGNYYTWAAAIADTMAHSSSSDIINTSICPAGWHLPYGGSGTGTNGGNTRGGFYYLGSELDALNMDTDSSQKFRAYPNNFVYSGYFNASNAKNRGDFGHYWSSTACNSGNAYYLYLGPYNVYPGPVYGAKGDGQSVRCVLGS